MLPQFSGQAVLPSGCTGDSLLKSLGLGYVDAVAGVWLSRVTLIVDRGLRLAGRRPRHLLLLGGCGLALALL